MVTEYFISFLDQLKQHWQNQSQALISAHINEEQNCLKHLSNLLEQLRPQQHKNANPSIQKPPQQSSAVTSDPKGAQECFIGLSVTNVSLGETSKNIHFLPGLKE